MRPRCHRTVLSFLVAALVVAPASAQIPTPESVLGFVPGTDRKLVEWPVLVEYYQALAAASDRVQYRELGLTTLGAPFAALVISSAENLARLDEIREMNGRLADPRLLASDAERQRILDEGKTVVLITSSIHSTEVGAHLTPTIIAHRLASENSPEVLEILDNVVTLLVPSLNPDGITIVSRWYNQTLDTPAEGTGPPELYHHYVGHDNNRDWYAFTQVETQLTIDSLHNVWHPQIVHDIHQQGQFGSRYFVPPFLDPVEPNVDPLLVQGFNTLGTFMAWELTGQGKAGIVVNGIYDAWTPARAYQHHHAGVRVLSETASARLATPVDIPFGRLRDGRNFDSQESSWNFAVPWEGGPWGLSDIVDYQSSGAMALLRHAARNRRIWLHNFVTIGERAVSGWDDWPYAFIIPPDQRSSIGTDAMLEILHRGMVEIRTAEASFTYEGETYPAGSYVVVLRQPYASFGKALLERQDYPDLRMYAGGPPRPPYDVTAHTLPLLMGVDVVTIETEIDIPLSAPIDRPAPQYVYEGLSVGTPSNAQARVGLYKSYTASMDEGWTRWIFDTWNVPYQTLFDRDVQAGNLADRFDAIVIPDMSARDITNGLTPPYPAQFQGGLGTDGVGALRRFVENGGTLVVFNEATEFAIDAFQLPVRDVVDGLDEQAFYAPGSLFEVELDTTHAVTRNMPATTAVWFQESPVFEVTPSETLKVVARYPADSDSVLLSGWVLHPERAAGRAALVEATVGAGRVLLYGFRPQYRAQSIATYPLFFNALMARETS